jgi:hypothetical protein
VGQDCRPELGVSWFSTRWSLSAKPPPGWARRPEGWPGVGGQATPVPLASALAEASVLLRL